MSIVDKVGSFISPVSVTVFGAKETLQGSVDISEGNLLAGVKKIFAGLTAINLGTRWMGLTDGTHQELMKYSLCMNAGSVAVKGLIKLKDGISQRSSTQIMKGLAQAAAGAVASICIDTLDSKVLLVAHQASLLAVTSYYPKNGS